MATPLASAVAGNVLEHLRVPGSKVVYLLQNRRRPRWFERHPGKGREGAAVGLCRQGGRRVGLRAGGSLNTPVGLGPPVSSRKDHEGAGEAGGRQGDQLVNHGLSIVTDFPIGLER
jgi:hypothetical protein